jgi:hypothetical protein
LGNGKKASIEQGYCSLLAAVIIANRRKKSEKVRMAQIFFLLGDGI